MVSYLFVSFRCVFAFYDVTVGVNDDDDDRTAKLYDDALPSLTWANSVVASSKARTFSPGRQMKNGWESRSTLPVPAA